MYLGWGWWWGEGQMWAGPGVEDTKSEYRGPLSKHGPLGCLQSLLAAKEQPASVSRARVEISARTFILEAN